MKEAIFFHGVFRSGLEEIVAAQQANTEIVTYLQPYSTKPIRLLRDHTPTSDSPLTAYFSTTDALGDVGFRAFVVGWRDKRDLTQTEIDHIDRLIRQHQPEENGLYLSDEEHVYVNLILVKKVAPLQTAFPVTHLTKVSDGKPHEIRSMDGGASHVMVPLTAELPAAMTADQFEARLASDSVEAHPLSDSELSTRLANASVAPVQVSVTSRAFLRNPYVAEFVLRRAAGTCEGCHKPAPFLRVSDGSPYLEIHHVTPLAEGGADSTDNTVALCPNCHRKAHYGIPGAIPRSTSRFEPTVALSGFSIESANSNRLTFFRIGLART